MPLDPSIVMGFRLPQTETPFQHWGNALTLRNQFNVAENSELERQRRIAFDKEIQSLPEDQRTTENYIKIASKYVPAKELYQEGIRSQDKNAQINATMAMNMARISETHRMNDARIADMFNKTQDQATRTKLMALKQANDAWAQRSAAAARDINTYYNTGNRPDVGMPPDITGALMQIMQGAPQQAAPQSAPVQQPRLAGYDLAPQATPQPAPRPAQQPSPATFPRETPEQRAAATARAGQTKEQELADERAMLARLEGDPSPQAETTRQIHRQNIAALEREIGGPTALVNPPPDNLDTRDIRARTPLVPTPGQGVPAARAAAEAQAAGLTAQMPPEIQKMYDTARSPKEKEKIKAQWQAGVIKAEIDRVKQVQGAKASEDVVKAIAEGRMQAPTGFALRSPYWQDVMERVQKANPQFDASIFGARAAARRTFASGPEARNVTALNTVIGHLGTLDEAAQAMDNGNIRLANAAANRMATEMGDPRVQNFDTAKQAVAEETMRVFRQVGASEREAREWGERITSSGSPAQLRGVINTLGKLLESRVEAIAEQYERTVNQKGNPAKIDPKNRKLLDELKKPLDDKSKVDSLLDKYK